MKVVRSIQEMALRAARAFETTVAPTLSAFLESMRRLPEEAKPGIRGLMERGWFISGEMGASELREFTRIAEIGNGEQLDASMSQWTRTELENVLARACARFPNREAILRAAFSAHVVGTYELSVPVLLIQVEGMCVEVLGKKLFSTSRGVPQTKQAADLFIDGAFSEVILLPLREVHGLTASESARASWPNAPNRHEILHGRDLGYGVELNSLKVISLLEYFVTFVAKERDTRTKPPLSPNNSLHRT